MYTMGGRARKASGRACSWLGRQRTSQRASDSAAQPAPPSRARTVHRRSGSAPSTGSPFSSHLTAGREAGRRGLRSGSTVGCGEAVSCQAKIPAGTGRTPGPGRPTPASSPALARTRLQALGPPPLQPAPPLASTSKHTFSPCNAPASRYSAHRPSSLQQSTATVDAAAGFRAHRAPASRYSFHRPSSLYTGVPSSRSMLPLICRAGGRAGGQAGGRAGRGRGRWAALRGRTDVHLLPRCSRRAAHPAVPRCCHPPGTARRRTSRRA